MKIIKATFDPKAWCRTGWIINPNYGMQPTIVLGSCDHKGGNFQPYKPHRTGWMLSPVQQPKR